MGDMLDTMERVCEGLKTLPVAAAEDGIRRFKDKASENIQGISAHLKEMRAMSQQLAITKVSDNTDVAICDSASSEISFQTSGPSRCHVDSVNQSRVPQFLKRQEFDLSQPALSQDSEPLPPTEDDIAYDAILTDVKGEEASIAAAQHSKVLETDVEESCAETDETSVEVPAVKEVVCRTSLPDCAAHRGQVSMDTDIVAEDPRRLLARVDRSDSVQQTKLEMRQQVDESPESILAQAEDGEGL